MALSHESAFRDRDAYMLRVRRRTRDTRARSRRSMTFSRISPIAIPERSSLVRPPRLSRPSARPPQISILRCGRRDNGACVKFAGRRTGAGREPLPRSTKSRLSASFKIERSRVYGGARGRSADPTCRDLSLIEPIALRNYIRPAKAVPLDSSRNNAKPRSTASFSRDSLLLSSPSVKPG